MGDEKVKEEKEEEEEYKKFPLGKKNQGNNLGFLAVIAFKILPAIETKTFYVNEELNKNRKHTKHTNHKKHKYTGARGVCTRHKSVLQAFLSLEIFKIRHQTSFSYTENLNVPDLFHHSISYQKICSQSTIHLFLVCILHRDFKIEFHPF